MSALTVVRTVLLGAALALLLATDTSVSSFGSSFLRWQSPGEVAACPLCCDLSRRLPVNTSQFDYSRYPALSRVQDAACVPRSHGGEASSSNAAWTAVVSRVATAPSLRIVVVGGSEAGGVDCQDPSGRTLKQCAWSARFAELLRATRPGVPVELFNYASGGTHVVAALPLLPSWLREPADPDLLLVDFIVNDAYEAGDFGGSTQRAVAAYEKFLEVCRSLHPRMPVVFVNTCAVPRCTHANVFIKAVAAHYDIPVVSYFDLVWLASQVSGGPVHESYWGVDGRPHPGWDAHQLIAETFARCLAAAATSLCFATPPAMVSAPVARPPPPFLSSPEQLESVDTCDRPVSEYSAFDPPESGWRHENWPVVAERADKPGWVSGAPNARLSFDVTFGKTPRLILSYLRSYKDLGNALMWFSARPDLRLPLEGLYNPTDPAYGQQVSQSFLLTMNVGSRHFQPELGSSGVVGFKIGPGETHTLNFEVAPGESFKFKLISVSSC